MSGVAKFLNPFASKAAGLQASKALASLAEPGEPILKTRIPGPQSNILRADLDSYSNTKDAAFFADFSKSKGNFVVDVDGNALLDVNTSSTSFPLGYNNEDLISALNDARYNEFLLQRSVAGSLPSESLINLLNETLAPLRPEGLNDFVTTASDAGSALENALKVAYIRHHQKQRAGKAISANEAESSLNNQIPGTSNGVVISFKNASHAGASFGASVLNGTDGAFAEMGWPKVSFPKLKYPLDKFAKENQAEEAKSLSELETALKAAKGNPVVAIVVEPFQSNGDAFASPKFFAGIRNLATKYDITLIADESETVFSTGATWGHAAWGLGNEPDICVFSKKAQAAGFYLREEFRSAVSDRLYTGFNGDALNLLQLNKISQIIDQQGLLKRSELVGDFLRNNLEQIASSNSGLVSDVRGEGSLSAFSLKDQATRDATLGNLRQRGIFAAPSGADSIRVRPTLTFSEHHATVFSDRLDQSLKALK